MDKTTPTIQPFFVEATNRMRNVIGIFAHVVKFTFGVCPKLDVVQSDSYPDAIYVFLG